MITDGYRNTFLYAPACSCAQGEWTQDVGRLTLDVGDFGDAVEGLNISFVLRNPAFARTSASLTVSIKGMLTSAVHQDVRQPMTPPCSSSQSASCTESFENFEKLNFRDSDFEALDNPLINAAHGISRGNSTYDYLQRESPLASGQYADGRTQDDDVGRVREIEFITNHIAQSAASGLGHSGTHRPTVSAPGPIHVSVLCLHTQDTNNSGVVLHWITSSIVIWGKITDFFGCLLADNSLPPFFAGSLLSHHYQVFFSKKNLFTFLS